MSKGDHDPGRGGGAAAAARVASAGELAQGLAQLVSTSLSDAAVAQLREMLVLHSGLPRRAARRDARLGLLAELVVACCDYVTAEMYDEARRERLTAGEQWVSASELASDWGHWLLAVQATLRMLHIGGRHAVSGAGKRREGPWKRLRDPLDIVWELQRFERAVGSLPTPVEYDIWIDLQRRLARAYPRKAASRALPTAEDVRAVLGSHAAAVRLAHAVGDVSTSEIQHQLETLLLQTGWRPPSGI